MQDPPFILQRSIRPQVVTTFELPSCVNMWTVTGPPSADQNGSKAKVNCLTLHLLVFSADNLCKQFGP